VRDFLSEEGDDFPDGRELARRMGHRTTLVVPLLREGESIGAIGLRRTEVHPFSDKQITLPAGPLPIMAVIAIETFACSMKFKRAPASSVNQSTSYGRLAKSAKR